MDRGEGIVRWSPNPRLNEFLTVNIGYPKVTLNQAIGKAVSEQFDFAEISEHNECPALVAYDWSPKFHGLVAVGTKSGDVHLLRVDDGSNAAITIPLKLQRTCNSVAFSTTGLLAVGLDRVRNGQCLQIWDIEKHLGHWKPHQKGWQKPQPFSDPLYGLEPSVAVTSVRFFEDQPKTLAVGIKNSSVKIHDLRDPHGAVITFQTRCNNNIAIDHADPNYLASSALDQPGVVVWDRRAVGRQSASDTYLGSIDAGEVPWGCVLKLDRVIDSRHESFIRGLRYCRDRAGLLGVLSSTGELQVLHTRKEYTESSNGVDVVQGPELLEVEKTSVLQYSSAREGFEYPMTERVVSFDWMTLGSGSLQPRLITRSYNQAIDIKLLPTRVETTLYDLLRFGNSNAVIADVDLPQLRDAQQALAVYGPFATVLAGRNIQFPVSGEPVNLDMERLVSGQQDIRSHPDRTVQVAKICKERLLWTKASAKSTSDHNITDSNRHFSSRSRHVMSHENNLKISLESTIWAATSQQIATRIEKGYLFDSSKNQVLLKDDSWLKDVWSWIEGAVDAAKQDGMVADNLDLSYLGVGTVWGHDLGTTPTSRVMNASEKTSAAKWESALEALNDRAGSTTFEGVKSLLPQHRRLCLAICGWGKATKELDYDMRCFEDGGNFTKAAVWALVEKRPEQAIDVLRKGGNDLVFVALALELQNAGTGTINKAQWDPLFLSHPRMASDPYLRAIYALISTGDWRAIADETSLPLRERAGIAIQNFSDVELTNWLKKETENAVKNGDIEGIILTGITERLVDILCGHIQRFGDFQTATLIASFCSPRYIQDYRCNRWRQEYKFFHNNRRLFIPRCKFDVGSTKLSKIRDGTTAIKPPQRQVTLRCVHCNTHVSNDLDVPSRVSQGQPPQQVFTHEPEQRNPLLASGINGGIACPKCGKHLPRCALCLQILGLPRSEKQDLNATKETISARFITFCMKCDHAMHADHSRQWFESNNECAVADCHCTCNADDVRIRRDREIHTVTTRSGVADLSAVEAS